MTNSPPFPIPNWQAAAADKRKALFESIPSSHLLPPGLAARAADHDLLPSDAAVLSCGILTPLDLEITAIDDAATLVEHITSGKYSSVQVTEAFCKRASIAQQTTNCLTEIFYQRALERAAWLDEYLAQEGKPFGILHGLPVSLKDCYGVKGIPSTAGLVSWLPHVSDKDSSVAKALLDAGAVLYVKTNMSQALLMVESINNIFDTTRNPYHLDLSVGGSSGGEAGLLAARGAILGTGTDGGGSIRFPSSFCGLCKTLSQSCCLSCTNVLRQGVSNARKAESRRWVFTRLGTATNPATQAWGPWHIPSPLWNSGSRRN